MLDEILLNDAFQLHTAAPVTMDRLAEHFHIDREVGIADYQHVSGPPSHPHLQLHQYATGPPSAGAHPYHAPQPQQPVGPAPPRGDPRPSRPHRQAQPPPYGTGHRLHYQDPHHR
ncbi:uncharacterized protein DS421_6g194560 [Arachis hypogaea]|nr:uncharacterized protein DS421_6g194560 [Arachis hypogaea]